MTSRSWYRALAVAAGAVLATTLLVGCRSEMYDQPRYEALEPTSFFKNGTSARASLPGTIARGRLPLDDLLHTGKVGGQFADAFPFPIARADMVRGQSRYRIYCAPCHGELGDGQGVIVQRGFPAPPPYYGATRPSPTGTVPTYADLRLAPAGHFFDVITHGHGVMYSYASRIGIEDRWRIVAYVRALQLSQHASADDLKALPKPKAEESKLIQEAGRP